MFSHPQSLIRSIYKSHHGPKYISKIFWNTLTTFFQWDFSMHLKVRSPEVKYPMISNDWLMTNTSTWLKKKMWHWFCLQILVSVQRTYFWFHLLSKTYNWEIKVGNILFKNIIASILFICKSSSSWRLKYFIFSQKIIEIKSWSNIFGWHKQWWYNPNFLYWKCWE